MASAELQVVLEMLRSEDVIKGASIHEQRANMEASTVGMPMLEDVAVESVDIGGVPAEWARAGEAPTDRAIVYLHGGGYCLGSLNTHRLLTAGLAKAADVPVLAVDYRLAPEHAHPAAVDDALAAIRWVREHGVSAERVVVAGDSAGGGLTVASLLALREAGEAQPAGGVCISPWTDLGLGGATIESKADVDPLVRADMLREMAAAYLGGAAVTTPTASPGHADLAGLPPLLVQVGSEEILLDDARALAERAEAAGVEVELEVWDEMFHVWHAFALLLPEGQQAIDRIGAWVRARLGGT